MWLWRGGIFGPPVLPFSVPSPLSSAIISTGEKIAANVISETAEILEILMFVVISYKNLRQI